jgi:FtsH-binding integral membrane protein
MAVIKTQSLVVVWQALGLTLFAFGGLTGYVLVSGKDFSFMKGFIWTGFWILVGFMVVGFFVNSWAYPMGITAAGLLVFAGFVLYDTSEIMHRYQPTQWVAGAFSLFIDFINMFIRVLFLLLGRRN